MPSIELHPAQRDELDCIENLMQFYLYELSEWLPLKFAPHGLFAIQSQLDYWRKPGTHPLLIKVDAELAGFVTIDNDVHFADVQYNIGYFFISRRFRGQGLGKQAVTQLFNRHPGQWQVFHIDANQPACAFWAKVIPALTHGEFSRHPISASGYACTLYKFQFPARPAC